MAVTSFRNSTNLSSQSPPKRGMKKIRRLTLAEVREISASTSGQTKKKKLILVKSKAELSNRPELDLLKKTSGLKDAGNKSNPQVIIQMQDDDHTTTDEYKSSDQPAEIYVPHSKVEEYFEKIVHLFTAIQFSIQTIDNKLDNTEKARPMPEENDYTILAHFLPINNIESINHFEVLIKTDLDSVAQFRKMLTQTGGRSVKDNIHRTLKKIFTNACALQCSWKGRKNNFRVSDLAFVQIMKETFCAAFPTITEAEFETICSEWFRFAKQRLVREESKLLHQAEHLQYEQNN